MFEGGILGTVLGSVLGFLASLLPEIFGLIRDRVAKPPVAEGEVQNPGPVVLEPHKMGQNASPAPSTHSCSPDDTPRDAPLPYLFLDYLRASVRPVLTYAFFALFAFIKVTAMYHAFVHDHTAAVDLLPILWDEGTEALFAAVLSFWFGSRAMARFRKKK